MTDKQAAFVNEYVKDFNATQAALRAGYSPRSAYAIGHQNLGKERIAKEISRRVEEHTMSANEVLIRLAQQARAECAEYITVDGDIDMDRIIRDDKAHLIKSVKITPHGKTIEFHDAQTALIKIGEAHGIFKQKHDVDGNVTLQVVYGDTDGQSPETA